MAITTKGKSWEARNSWYILLGLIPFFNAVAFFHMSGRVPNKKWKTMGWVVLFVNLLLIIVMITGIVLEGQVYNWYPTPEKTYSDVYKADYFGDDYYNYSSEELLTHPYYDDYIQAKQEYEEAENNYKNSVEYKTAINARERARGMLDAIALASLAFFIIFNIVILFSLIAQRAEFLRALAQQENQGQLAARFAGTPVAQSRTPSAANIPPQAPPVQQPYAQTYAQPMAQPAAQPVAQPTANPNALNLNAATEEQIAALPGLTIIDAKKAVEYRDANGGFRTVDEFYNAISIKPHIMARIEGTVFAGQQAAPASHDAKNNSGRRMIDF